MTSEQLTDLAMKAYSEKKFKDAGSLFGQAADLYSSNGDLLMAAEMKNNQSVALLQNGDAQASLDAVIGTDELFARNGDKKRQGMALANQASALDALKKKKEALELFERSEVLLAEAGENNLRADVLRSISKIKIGQGKFIDAVMSMQDGMIEIKEPTLKQRILKKLLFLRLWR